MGPSQEALARDGLSGSLHGQHNMFTVNATLKSLPEGGRLATWVARGPNLVAALLVVLLGVRCAGLVTDFAGGQRGRPAVDASVSIPALPAATDITALIGANLFGGGTGAAIQGPAPISNIPLVLVGVLAATDPALGVAILGPTAEAAKVYLVKDMLPGGARLFAVHPDRVLIDRGGTIEALLLPRQSAPPSAMRPAPSTQAPGVAERAQQLVQQGPGALAQVMRPQVVLDSQGKQQGFRIFPGGNRQAFAKLGLQAGDLVTAINGTALDDPGAGTNVFNTLATSPNARVTVQRDGKPQELVVNVAQALGEAERAAASATMVGPSAAGESVGVPSP